MNKVTEQKVSKVELVCESCEAGMMATIERGFATKPPQVKLKCGNCGFTKFSTVDYPYLKYEDKE